MMVYIANASDALKPQLLLFRKSNTYNKGFLEEFQVSTFDFTEKHAYTHIMN